MFQSNKLFEKYIIKFSKEYWLYLNRGTRTVKRSNGLTYIYFYCLRTKGRSVLGRELCNSREILGSELKEKIEFLPTRVGMLNVNLEFLNSSFFKNFASSDIQFFPSASTERKNGYKNSNLFVGHVWIIFKVFCIISLEHVYKYEFTWLFLFFSVYLSPSEKR